MSCCSESGLMPFEVAKTQMLEAIAISDRTKSVDLKSALGRVLRQEIHSQVDVPPMDNSGMDGYALRFEDLQQSKTLTLLGKSLAGHPYPDTVESGQCIRIMTGAKIPAGADTVIMQEKTSVDGDQVTFHTESKLGDNVRKRGEAININDVVFSPGRRLTAPDLGLLAALGISSVKVSAPLTAALLSTGDELKQPGEPLAESQIYESNSYAVGGMLEKMGVIVKDYGIIEDTPEAIESALTHASQHADIVITSGGVSVGEADFVKDALDKLGQVNFWKLAIKPGKPFTFGHLGKAVFFGLPGNPVSSMVTFYLLAIPAINKMLGMDFQEPQRIKAKLIGNLRKKPGRMDFQRGIYTTNKHGELYVESASAQGSGVLTSMSLANCFIVLPQDGGSVNDGEFVDIELFDSSLS